MKRKILHKGRTLALICIGLLASGSVFADKPSWSGGGNNNNHGNDDGWRSGNSNSDRQDDNRGNDDRSAGSESNYNRDDDRDHGDWDRDGNDHRADRDHYERDRTYSTRYFNEHTRNSIYDYYSQQISSGHCPPGLAKKNNGCLPPGHARQWVIGQRLPREVIFYNLQPQILTYLAPPPPRHRYVRVASDILLIAVGTGMVLDAIDDLGRL